MTLPSGRKNRAIVASSKMMVGWILRTVKTRESNSLRINAPDQNVVAYLNPPFQGGRNYRGEIFAKIIHSVQRP